MTKHPFQGFPSLAIYFRIGFTHDPPLSQEELIKPLIADGYTRRQALGYYIKNLARYRNKQMAQLAKEGVAVG